MSSLDEKESMSLTHLDKEGAARMVDVGHKPVTDREALAQAVIHMEASTLELLLGRELPKGDALQVARVAGILAAKQTPTLIPLCHPIPLSRVEIAFEPLDEESLRVTADVRNAAQTGVEMEALTACSVAALTVYDMAKAVDPGMVITDVCLMHKAGGKRGLWKREASSTAESEGKENA
jgi:cyclic pyranopterin phosphate synthase